MRSSKPSTFPRGFITCLETHGMVVDYRGGDSATIYASTQGTFTIPADAAKELGLEQSKVVSRCRTHGRRVWFEVRNRNRRHVCVQAFKTKSPVKLMLALRRVCNGGQSLWSWQKLKAGVKKDGTIVALKAQQYRLGGIGQGSQAGQPYICMGDTYREVYALHTNEDSAIAMRAPVIRRRRLRSNHSSTNSLTRSRWTRWSFEEEFARRGISPAVGSRRQRDRMVQKKSCC